MQSSSHLRNEHLTSCVNFNLPEDSIVEKWDTQDTLVSLLGPYKYILFMEAVHTITVIFDTRSFDQTFEACFGELPLINQSCWKWFRNRKLENKEAETNKEIDIVPFISRHRMTQVFITYVNENPKYWSSSYNIF